MLPCDESASTSMSVPRSPKTIHQTIRTPLQLFRADSPLVNRISIGTVSEFFAVLNSHYSRGSESNYVGDKRQFPAATSSKLLQFYCQNVRNGSIHQCKSIAAYSVFSEIPKNCIANFEYIFRFLLKQFHVFCQHSTGDTEVDSWKLDLMAAAPFKWPLLDFFKSSISQVPTSTVFRDIMSEFPTSTFFFKILTF